MTVFVDTSALIALLDEDDQHHLEASATFRSLLEQGAELVTHNYVHVESIAVIDRRLGREAMRRLVDSLLPVLSTIWVDEAVHRAALVAHRSIGGAVSLVDRVSFAVMRGHGIDSAFAFDADFQAQGFARPTVTGEARQGRRVEEIPEVYAATRADRTDLVSVSEISARSGRSINTIQSWRRRHGDFPEPVAQLAAGPIWAWPTVAQWISTRTSAQSGRSVLPAPSGWDETSTGEPMPDWVNEVRRERSTTITVSEAAKRAGKDPETIRRWIRSGKLRASKVGARHVIAESDLEPLLEDEMLPVPPEWGRTATGEPMPNVVRAVRLWR